MLPKPHVVKPPFRHTAGPRDASVGIVGVAWGAQEELTASPFPGPAGQDLSRLLKETGLPPSQCLLTNVFALRPANNNLDDISGTKTEVGGKTYTLPAIRQGRYIRPEFLGEVERLREEI